MSHRTQVSPLQAELYEVPAGLGALPGPELYVDLSHGGLQTNLTLTWGLLDIYVTHLKY